MSRGSAMGSTVNVSTSLWREANRTCRSARHSTENPGTDKLSNYCPHCWDCSHAIRRNYCFKLADHLQITVE